MQFLKKIILSTASLFTLSVGLFLSSCAPKNSCDTLVCKNGGTCAADFCNCPTGYDGPQCENKITDRFIGTYAGYTDPRNGQPTHLDTVDVYTSSDPLTLSVVRRRSYDIIYSGIIEYKTNNIVISDLVNESHTSVVNVSIKAPTSTSAKRTLSLNVLEYENNNRVSELFFNGQLVAQ
jgi:hypothetical protein